MTLFGICRRFDLKLAHDEPTPTLLLHRKHKNARHCSNGPFGVEVPDEAFGPRIRLQSLARRPTQWNLQICQFINAFVVIYRR